jgi:cell division protease FtsH
MHTYKKKYVQAQIAILMGGRVAEELSQDDITTGAGNDIDRATDLARQMVCDWGMSTLGPLSLGGGDEPVFLGRDFASKSEYSDETATRIDKEIESIVETGHQKANDILKEHSAVLDRVAAELLERETLDGDEVYAIIEEMTGQDVKPVRVHLQRPPSEETEEESEAAARVSEAPDDTPDAYPGSPEPAPAQFSALPPRKPGNNRPN